MPGNTTAPGSLDIKQFVNTFQRIWTYETTNRTHVLCEVDKRQSIRELAITFKRSFIIGRRRCDLQILGVFDAINKRQMTLFQREEEEKEGTSCRETCGSLTGGSGEDSRRRASAPAFLRRPLDRTCLSKFQFRWACPRSSSGGPSKVRGRGLVSGSCQGAVAEAGFVDEAYLVRSSWVVA
ncbi:hypothetical protein MTO96_038220 [Rhipicephalus appendiculatus]